MAEAPGQMDLCMEQRMPCFHHPGSLRRHAAPGDIFCRLALPVRQDFLQELSFDLRSNEQFVIAARGEEVNFFLEVVRLRLRKQRGPAQPTGLIAHHHLLVLDEDRHFAEDLVHRLGPANDLRLSFRFLVALRNQTRPLNTHLRLDLKQNAVQPLRARFRPLIRILGLIDVEQLTHKA